MIMRQEGGKEEKKGQKEKEGQEDGKEASQEDDQEGASQVLSLRLLLSAPQLRANPGQQL
jgi:hypothetical protein